MRSRCTCQSGLERWRWWAQTHGVCGSHGGMFRSMYASCDLKTTSVLHNLYAPWMPPRYTCQIDLKRLHSWEQMFILWFSYRHWFGMFCSIHSTYDHHNAPTLTQPTCPMNVIMLHLSDTSKTLAFVRAHVHFYTETLIRYVLQHTCNIWLSHRHRSDTTNMSHECHHIALVRFVWNASISENRRTFLCFVHTGDVHVGLTPATPWS